MDKAKVMYDFLDSFKIFQGTVDPRVPLLMNHPAS